MANFLQQVTVEPSFFINTLLFNWIDGFETNLFLQKSCRYNRTVEPDLNTKCDDERAGVLFISEVTSKYRFAAMFFATIVTIFSTTWSDKVGRRRKPLIHIVTLGQILIFLSGCLNSYFWHWSPTVVAITSTILYGLSGGSYLMIVACQIYLCDENNAENRTMKLGFIRAIQSICMILGKGSSGIILRRIGFFYSYLLCLILAIVSLIFGFIFIKDNSTVAEKDFRFYQVFNVKRTVLNNFKVVFHKKLGRKRVIVSLLILANTAVNFTNFGELSILYPYLRYRFGFDEQKYSVFSFYRFSLATLGTLFCSIILSKCLKVHDGLIGILAGSFDLVAITLLLLATQIWQIFTVPLLDIFHGCVMVIPVSFMSKYFNVNELGRLQAVNGVFALLFPFTFPAYNAIFKSTLDTFPSAFCLLSVGIDVVIILCFCLSYFFSTKIQDENPKGAREETRGMIPSHKT
ncbi:uncharacterized protein LOC135843252 [Planococcus citri]|uniref:uncharacterized protein LOC135843252 n=1 Tax=Planococcus citri TaxID=170843 RepID=UPI0031F97BE4